MDKFKYWESIEDFLEDVESGKSFISVDVYDDEYRFKIGKIKHDAYRFVAESRYLKGCYPSFEDFIDAHLWVDEQYKYRSGYVRPLDVLF